MMRTPPTSRRIRVNYELVKFDDKNASVLLCRDTVCLLIDGFIIFNYKNGSLKPTLSASELATTTFNCSHNSDLLNMSDLPIRRIKCQLNEPLGL